MRLLTHNNVEMTLKLKTNIMYKYLVSDNNNLIHYYINYKCKTHLYGENTTYFSRYHEVTVNKGNWQKNKLGPLGGCHVIKTMCFYWSLKRQQLNPWHKLEKYLICINISIWDSHRNKHWCHRKWDENTTGLTVSMTLIYDNWYHTYFALKYTDIKIDRFSILYNNNYKKPGKLIKITKL